MNSPVALVNTETDRTSLFNSIAKALQLINFDLDRKVNTIIVKPNLCYYWEASSGCTTDPRLVGALIDYLRERYGKSVTIKVAEADASAMKTNHVFPMLGYDKLAREKNVELLNLSTDVLRKEKVQVSKQTFEFEIPQSLLDADLFVNVPKLKTMRVTKITCAMKNIFGCIATPRKFVYHNHLDEAIVGINKILKPHLTIVDGLVALGRFPIKLNLIAASNDVFSTDWVVAQIAGYNPRKVKFLDIAMHEKLGNPKGIRTVGEDPKPYKRKFPRDRFISQKMLWNIEFGLLRLYKKVSADIIPPFLEE